MTRLTDQQLDAIEADPRAWALRPDTLDVLSALVAEVREHRRLVALLRDAFPAWHVAELLGDDAEKVNP